MNAGRRSPWAAALLTCALLAAAHTWPLATAPHRLSRHDNGDVMLNEWIITWVQRQLARDPRRLFDGNIFHPARDTLAYSEPLIVPALMSAPVRMLGGSPVLAHNLLMIAGLALTALAAFAVIYEWTGDRLAALVAASAFGFSAHMLARLAHVQALHAYGLALALLATDRILTHARTRDAVWLACWLTVMAYTSGYLFVYAAVMIPVAILARPGDWIRRPFVVLPRFALAGILAAAAILPLYLPYRRVAVEQSFVRPLEQVAEYSATIRSFATPSGRLHFYRWSENLFTTETEAYFPGIAVLAVAAFAVVAAARRRQPEDALLRRRVVMVVAIGAAGVLLSLGTRTPVYGWLYQLFPPISGIRVAVRFGNLFLLAMALLAGLGAARLRASGAPGRPAALAVVALVAIVNAEALRAPLRYSRFDGIPNVYSELAREAGPVVLVEQPFYPPQGIFMNAEYVLNSTAHWRPLMNGYSGHIPESYRRYAATFWFFPREHAVESMRRAGVTHVMVHPERFGQDAAKVKQAIESSPYLERIAVGRNDMTLYRLK